MRITLIVFLVGLFLLSLAPTGVAAITDTQMGEPSEADDLGPVRDWGDDWIFYDDGGNNWVFYPYYYLWARVSFTPNSEFQLEGVRVRIRNENGANDPELQIRIYTEGNNHALDDLIYQWSTDDIQDGWFNHEMAEEDYWVFDGGEDFSICVGPSPGDGPNGGANLWFPCGDQAGEGGHSYVAAANRNNGEPQGDWFFLDNNDLLIRANGTYQEDFFDLGLVSVYNEEGWDDAGAWMQIQGNEAIFNAELSNYGNDVEDEEYIINFTVLDPDGEIAFEHDMLGPAMEYGDTIAIECDEVWAIPEDAPVGLYNLWVTTIIEGDANEDNDQIGMDQIVFVPDIPGEDNAPDVWLGFIPADMDDDLSESNSIENVDAGRGVNFYHPGLADDNMRSIRVTDVRFAVSNDDTSSHNPGLKVGIINREVNQYAWVYGTEGETAADQGNNGWEWLEFEIPPADPDAGETPRTMAVGEALVIMYFTDDTQIMLNSNRPVSGNATKMPWVMATAAGNSLFATLMGDFAVEVKLAWDDAPRVGAHLFTVPARGEAVELGEDLDWDMDYEGEIELMSVGTDTVTVRNILVPRDFEDQIFVTLENGEDANQRFGIAPDESVVVTVRWHTPMDYVNINEAIRFVTNADVDPQFNIFVMGGTFESVNEHAKPGLPEKWSMSQNYPNPFNPTTTVDFAMVSAGDVTFGIYDMSGRLVKDVYSGELSAGYHSLEVNASDLTAGLYFYTLKTNEFSSTKKMVLLK